jgi:rod shape-determining protein MreC
MSIQRRPGRGTASLHVVSVVLIVLSLGLLGVSTKAINRVPELGAEAASGVQRLFSSVGNFFRDTIFSIRELSDLQKQYDALAKKMDEYAVMQRDYAELQAENARLKEQLGFAQSVTSIKTPAQIIARDPSNIYSSYVIDKGAAAGVAHNMAVVAFQDGVEGLVGRIIEVRQNSSVVIPLYDQRFYVSARFSSSRTSGLVNGQGNEDDPLLMRYVSKLNAAEIKKGDVVVTSGLDSIFPPNLTIGRVREVVMPDYGSSAVIYLDPVVPFAKLEYLFVLQNHTTESSSLTTDIEPASPMVAPSEISP